MGNQSSRAIEMAREKRENRRRSRRLSTATLGAQSHTSRGNYDWLEENQSTALSDHALHAALAAAAATQPPPHPPIEQPRRKSITEFFIMRKFTSSRPSEEDFREYDRLQRQHYLLKSVRKSNTWAPIDSPTVILEVGTGNGIWALEISAQYRQALVIGFDSRPPPEQTTVPKNLKFVQGDIHEKWPFEDNTIDFIFQRNMAQDIEKRQWPSVLGEMLRVLKPGGIVEFVEADPRHHNPGPVQQAFDTFWQEQWQAAGLDYHIISTLEDTLKEAGFIDIEQRVFDLPSGEWPEEPELKQFGFINMETQKAFLRNRKNKLMPKWGISSEDYDAAVREMMEEFEEYHGFSRFSCWIAKKPC